MVYPIVVYGDPVLKRRAEDIEKGSLDIKEFVANMYETMYAASGVGLAAPQIGKSVRVFVVDAEPMDEENLKGFKKAFINPEIIEETGNDWAYEEGCLSIPGIRADVSRPEKVRITYYDEDWNQHDETYEGLAARVIQHEYDHLEGVLFTDYLTAFKKRLIKSKLNNISRGQVKTDYRILAPAARK
jgi:peptide deformylase